jgi:hypothetical protein
MIAVEEAEALGDVVDGRVEPQVLGLLVRQQIVQAAQGGLPLEAPGADPDQDAGRGETDQGGRRESGLGVGQREGEHNRQRYSQPGHTKDRSQRTG